MVKSEQPPKETLTRLGTKTFILPTECPGEGHLMPHRVTEENPGWAGSRSRS
jgi:hypothetical protein